MYIRYRFILIFFVCNWCVCEQTVGILCYRIKIIVEFVGDKSRDKI